MKQMYVLTKWRSKWPAIIFATSRTDRVIGRIRLLTISINTIIGINIVGEPIGTIWDNILLVFLMEKYITFVVHIIISIGRTIDIWAVIINEVGIIDIKLNAKIEKNIGIKKLFLKFLLVNVLNSICRVFLIVLVIELLFDIIIKNGEIIINRGISHPELK